MKKIYHIFFLLLFGFICTFTNAQNLLYQKIEQEKRNGEKFEIVKDIFSKTESNKEILREFKNPEGVSFINYNPAVFEQLGKTITLEIPLNNKSVVIELAAVDNEFYNYTVTTEKGDAFPANRAIKHYRGVIKNDKNSLVALSFSAETANGIIANANGNYNISSINDTKATVFFKDDSTIYENVFECGVIDNDFDPKKLQQTEPILTNEPLTLQNFKCLQIYFELRYDMFERFAFISTTDVDTVIISKTVGYFTAVFNQVATLYFNAGINAYISELKINTGPDPYPLYQTGSFSCGTSNNYSNNSLCIYKAFGNNLNNSYNGDIAQLISAQSSTSWGTGILNINSQHQNKTICQVEKKNLFSFAGIGIETNGSNNNLFSNYSWNINVIIHELGHVLGSNHTQTCVWNGNNTAIDNCGPHYYTVTNTNPFGSIDGIGCYNPSNPILPSNGGTIMSYCHLLSNIKINFANGFGDQPRDRIRSKICNERCLIRSYCFVNINMGYADNKSATNDYNVPSGHIDNRKISNNIYAYHTIESGGQANYSAGNSIRLLPNTLQYYDIFQQKYLYHTGFHAKAGSEVLLQIIECAPMDYTITSTNETSSYEEDNNIELEPFVNLYPNPTPDVITIESNEEIIAWEIANEAGKILRKENVNKLTHFQVNFSNFSTGVYFIKIYLNNGQFVFKKMIKQ